MPPSSPGPLRKVPVSLSRPERDLSARRVWCRTAPCANLNERRSSSWPLGDGRTPPSPVTPISPRTPSESGVDDTQRTRNTARPTGPGRPRPLLRHRPSHRHRLGLRTPRATRAALKPLLPRRQRSGDPHQALRRSQPFHLRTIAAPEPPVALAVSLLEVPRDPNFRPQAHLGPGTRLAGPHSNEPGSRSRSGGRAQVGRPRRAGPWKRPGRESTRMFHIVMNGLLSSSFHRYPPHPPDPAVVRRSAVGQIRRPRRTVVQRASVRSPVTFSRAGPCSRACTASSASDSDSRSPLGGAEGVR